MDNDTLVIRVNAFLHAKDMEQIRIAILKQRKTGVVLLPIYCEPMFVPKDVEIKLEKGELNHVN